MIKNYQPAILLGASILLSALAQLLMKAAMLAFRDLPATSPFDLLMTIEAALQNHLLLFWLFAGIACYGLSMLAWLLALTRYQISYAYPMLGLSYVLVYLGAVYWDRIGESLSVMRSIGILLVIIGVALVNMKSAADDG